MPMCDYASTNDHTIVVVLDGAYEYVVQPLAIAAFDVQSILVMACKYHNDVDAIIIAMALL